MADFIYQSLVVPVLTAEQTPESVTESRWHQPWSEPRNPKLAWGFAIAIAAAGMFAPTDLTPPEQVTLSRWMQPLSEPVRVKPGIRVGTVPHQFLVKAAPFLEIISMDKWAFPLSEPVRIKPGLHAALQGFLAPRSYNLVFEGTSMDKWWKDLSTPVWLPRRLQVGQEPQFAFAPSEPFLEAIQLKWFAPLSEPVRLPIGLKWTLQHTFTLPDWPDFERYAWMSPLSEPKRRSYRVSTTLGTSRAPQRSELVPKQT